ncbi:MAG: hypothetical protein H6842_07895 [Rhodospirillaceae bacterium]|nr:hypothetical protein [Rhodospirillaceae bacterium]
MMRCAYAAFLAIVLAALPAAAQDRLPLDAFFGTWSGTGVAEDDDSLFFAVTARDLDIVIRPHEDGFRIDWTTLIRSGGDPSNPDVRRRSATLVLRPAGQPGLYRGAESGDPLQGGTMSWARIHGSTLSVYELTLNEDGGYELTNYDRTLNDLGMESLFQRIRDGEVVRVVRGRLVKTGS